MGPLFVKVHERDNVAIIVNANGLPAGAEFSNGLVLVEATPQAHKVTLRDLAAGESLEDLMPGKLAGELARLGLV